MLTRYIIYYKLLTTLRTLYPQSEAAAIAERYCNDVCGFGYFDLTLNPSVEVEDLTEVGFEGDMARLAAGEPVQYVIGWTEFCDLRFWVRSGVLIPRPETEELVAMIVGDNRLEEPRILDIGTGSGAIAVSLAHKIKGAQVEAMDLSVEALEVAHFNARSHGLKVELFQDDVLEFEPEPESLDVVVSNPPYIPQSESATMWRNVVDYEPSMALFVPDENPIVFYERIADVAWEALVSGGKLYFELHETTAHDVAAMARRRGFCEVEVVADINSKPRMLRCVKP